MIPADSFVLLDFLAKPVCWCPEGSPARLSATRFDEVEEKSEEMPLRLRCEGIFDHMWGSEGKAQGQLNEPYGVAVCEEAVFVTDFGNNRVQMFTLDGDFLRMWGWMVQEKRRQGT